MLIISQSTRMLLAGIQKKSLDARLCWHDGRVSDTHLCEALQSMPEGLLYMVPHRKEMWGRLSGLPDFHTGSEGTSPNLISFNPETWQI